MGRTTFSGKSLRTFIMSTLIPDASPPVLRPVYKQTVRVFGIAHKSNRGKWGKSTIIR